MSKYIIVKMTADHIKIKGGEYVKDYEYGEWIKEGMLGGTFYRCSVCGEFPKYRSKIVFPWEIHAKYCPNCGADMREREGE